MSKHLSTLLVVLILLSCQAQKTERQIEDEFVKKYAPKNLNTYGFTLAVDSKVPEVHQLFNDLEANFYFYGNKNEFEKKAAKIIELDPNYPSGYLMSGFYIQDPEEYKKMVTKAYTLSKKANLKSERDIMKAEYLLLVKEDYPEAQKYFQKVVDIYPDSAAAIWSLGMAYYYNNEYDKAFECYKKSTELIPNLPKGYEFMSVICYEKKQYKKALEYLELAKKHGAKTKNDIYYAEYEHLVYYKNGLYNKTITSIEQAKKYGKYYKNSESLKKTYEAAQTKLDSIQSSKL
ncbi:tetratricopeptide repeat protein [Aquimarina algicola]|uniref:Tetratricopeptide repeat protein n=1 Tax=Aquimarina algicola TaxID=2589995 RepID=A0A504J8G8_9FLAO|nr:tetratricopeptide repeat protein [Aquimarina algicola]TPN83349.1 tetratricopeptide repeat protein [Aquimarina algicola]